MTAMPATFTDVVAALDSGLVIVTTAVDGERAGCLVGFHTQSSMEPPRYCVWLSKANHTARCAQRSMHLAVQPVPEDEFALAERFGTLTGDTTDKFAGLAVRDGPGGVPLLDACRAGVLLLKTTVLDDGGDHLCVTGDVVDAWYDGPHRPLRMSRAGELEPGHGNRERPHPPTERAD